MLDLNLLDSDGAETVKKFREIAGSEIPIIVLTNSKDHEMRVEALLAGADDYLVKKRDDKLLCERIVQYTFRRYTLIKQGHEDDRYVKV